MNHNALIDRFVEMLNECGLQSLAEQEVPPELRIGVPNDNLSLISPLSQTTEWVRSRTRELLHIQRVIDVLGS
jgi:hypothetical protein